LTKRRLILWPLGVGCIAVGVAGCVLPVLPGWPFLFAGLSIFAPRTAVRLRRSVNRRLFKPETLHVDEWRRLGAHAGYTTKRFPLVLKKTDEWLEVSNQKRFKELFWKTHVALEHEKAASGRFVFLQQVHGDGVVVLDGTKLPKEGDFHRFTEADGVVTDAAGLTLLVLTADCAPVFLCAGKEGAEWIGLVHAGWRGTRLGIVQKAVKMLCERSGLEPSDVRAAFGPCIGWRNYPVGPEFADYFAAGSIRRRGGKLHLDLAGENRRQLLEAGLRPDRISDPRLCTVAGNRDFWSFRKEKDAAGRTISFIRKL
jgi:YfiH family protein